MRIRKIHYKYAILIICFWFVLYFYQSLKAGQQGIESSEADIQSDKKENMWKLPYYMAETKVFYRCIEPKTFALTFDDAPSDYVPIALKTLNRYKVPATFYVIGKIAQRHPQYVKMLDEDPLAMIASHTYEHDPSLIFLESEHKVREQVEKGIEILYNITGKRFRHFRPPHLNLDEFGYLEQRSGLAIGMDSVDVSDWEIHFNAELSYANQNASDRNSAKIVTDEIIDKLEELLDEDEGDEEGHIYVGHDRQFIFMGLHRMIRFLTRRGYTLVRMDRCTGVPETF